MNTHKSDAYTISPELPAMFDGMKLAAVATVLYIIVRCLNLKSPTAPPDLTYQDTPLSRFLLKSCPQLTKEWVVLSMSVPQGITLEMLYLLKGRTLFVWWGFICFVILLSVPHIWKGIIRLSPQFCHELNTKVCFQCYPKGRLLLPPASRDLLLFLGEVT